MTRIAAQYPGLAFLQRRTGCYAWLQNRAWRNLPGLDAMATAMMRSCQGAAARLRGRWRLRDAGRPREQVIRGPHRQGVSPCATCQRDKATKLAVSPFVQRAE